MFEWKKIGKVFDPSTAENRPWLKEFAQAPATLVFDDFVRVYFSCRPPADNKGQYVSYSAWVDLERNDLTRVIRLADQPILKLGNRGEFDEFGTYPVSVIRNKDEVWAYYAGWTRCQSVPFNVAIGLAISHDQGKTFKKIGPGPVLSYSPDEPFVLSGPKIRRFNNTFYLFYIAGKKWILSNGKPEPVYRIRMASSEDGLTWKKENRDLIAPRIEENEAQASPDVFYLNGKYHMLFCYRYSENFREGEHGYRIGYASSYDLLNWQRDDSQAGLTLSENGWDSKMQSYPHILDLDDTIWLFYLGNYVGKHGFGIAKLISDKQTL